jgi:hypothetical protein
MGTEIEEKIRARAYAIWEQEGRPDGKHLEHWLQAKRLIAAEASRAMAAAMVTHSPPPQALSNGGDV